MNDLISRQAAIDAVEHITSSMSVCVNSDECHGMKRMQRQTVIELTNLPPAQPERKTGRWIDAAYDFIISGRCSVCGWEAHLYEDDVVGMNYCPNCGARMDGFEEE